MTTGEFVVAGAAALGLVVGFSTGYSTGGVLATGEEVGVDGVSARLYPVIVHLELATSCVGQVKDPNRRWSYW